MMLDLEAELRWISSFSHAWLRTLISLPGSHWLKLLGFGRIELG